MVILLIFWLLIPFSRHAQQEKRAEQVLIRDMHNKPMNIPYLGEKNLLIFYFDPDHPNQNKPICDYLKKNRITSPGIFAFGIANLKDAPLLPNAVVRFMVRREMKETGTNIYTDVDNSLSKGWNLGNVNNKFCILFVDTNSNILFFKADELTEAEQKELLTLIQKY